MTENYIRIQLCFLHSFLKHSWTAKQLNHSYKNVNMCTFTPPPLIKKNQKIILWAKSDAIKIPIILDFNLQFESLWGETSYILSAFFEYPEANSTLVATLCSVHRNTGPVAKLRRGLLWRGQLQPVTKV
jgi:hypothetical protein